MGHSYFVHSTTSDLQESKTDTPEPASPTACNANQAEEKPQEAGYLRRAVGGVASGLCAAG